MTLATKALKRKLVNCKRFDFCNITLCRLVSERQEEKLKFSSRELNMVKMKSMFAIGMCFTALFSTCSSIFEGRAVAKLPFVPISFVKNLSHS